MAQLYGRSYGRGELAARTGRIGALGGITPVVLQAGRGQGVRALEVATGGGLSFLALADRGLDVSFARYDGIPLCWQSCNDVASPAFCDPHGEGFLRTFLGGLFTTCGLGNFGPAGSDQWGIFGLHGRIAATPAQKVEYEAIWEGDECRFEIRGTFHETRVFGEDLRLERRLRTSLGSRSLEMHDEVSNDGGSSRPHMLLYHCNGGFPILDEAAKLDVSHRAMQPRDAQAETGLAQWNRGGAPDPAFKEQASSIRRSRAMTGWPRRCSRIRNCVSSAAWRSRFASIPGNYRRSSLGACSDTAPMSWGWSPRTARRSKAGSRP